MCHAYVDGVGVLNNEPQATNLFLFSEDFTGSGWSNQRGTIAKDSSNPSIQAGKNSTKWQLTSETGVKYLRVGASRTGEHTFSIYVKKGNYRYIGLLNTNSAKTVLDFDTGNIVIGSSYSEVESLSGGWFRISLKYTWSGSFNYSGIYFTDETGVDLTISTGNEYFYIDAAQMQTGDKADSYIVTNGATSTRLADTGFQTPDISKWINKDEFNIDVVIKFKSISNNQEITLGSSSGNRLRIQLRPSGQLFVFFYANGTQVIQLSSNINLNEEYNIRVKSKSGDSKLYINDNLQDSSSVSFVYSEHLKHLLLSDISGSVSDIEAIVKQIEIKS